MEGNICFTMSCAVIADKLLKPEDSVLKWNIPISFHFVLKQRHRINQLLILELWKCGLFRGSPKKSPLMKISNFSIDLFIEKWNAYEMELHLNINWQSLKLYDTGIFTTKNTWYSWSYKNVVFGDDERFVTSSVFIPPQWSWRGGGVNWNRVVRPSVRL
jgi:hypothetical protein